MTSSSNAFGGLKQVEFVGELQVGIRGVLEVRHEHGDKNIAGMSALENNVTIFTFCGQQPLFNVRTT